jgi:beta-barrel assembly-enhancing protease
LRLDFPNHPQKYLKAAAQADSSGQLYAVVQNPTPVAVGRVQVRVSQLDAKTGRIIAQSQPLTISSGIAPNKLGNVAVRGVRITTEQELRLYRVSIEGAELAR